MYFIIIFIFIKNIFDKLLHEMKKHVTRNGGIIMPTNKKEDILFGICMCVIMVFFMGLLNISIHLGGFNLNSIKTTFIVFPVTLIFVKFLFHF